jgi:HK97 family phage major capsid protein
MRTLIELRRELAGKVADAKAILAAADSRALAPEEETRYDALIAEMDQLQGEIKKEERRLDLESRNLGDPPAGGAGAEGAAGAGAGESEFRSAGEFFQAVKRKDPRLAETRDATASGHSEAVDADGGYLVQPEYAKGLMTLAEQQSVLLDKVTRTPVTSTRLVFTRLEDLDRADGKRNGGAMAYWIGEAAQYTASNLKFAQDSVDLFKLTALTFATDELLEDAPALESVINKSFSDEFSFKIDDAILNGTGTGQPSGILTAAKNPALAVVPKESGQAAGTVVFDNILKMWNAMPSGNRQKAVWLISQDIEIQLMKLFLQTGSANVSGGDADTALSFGVPVYMPATGLSSSPYSTLLGRPVIPAEQCAAPGAVGDIVLADLSQYRWIDKGGIRGASSIHVRFDYDETCFKFTYRAGGKPIWPAKLSPYKGATARSPYVALAARA